MEHDLFEATLADVDGCLSRTIAGLISSPSNPAECLPLLEQAARSLTGLPENKLPLATPEMATLLGVMSDRVARAEALLETAAAFHVGCLMANNNTGDYLTPNHDAYTAGSPSLVRAEA